ncbi:MAG: hypothetical protein HN658_10210 [Rhodospirillales bacterium]|jgi:adenosylcobinamide-GDP ribazoletransferase|nr:hypothetical protein [Rhodospirillales bacterium]MBT4005508.1 hypothetical protein [Rhodospirillales bacterium]MBT5076918.1 hypothetical protein [Rhodospirillales bacterium]MBT5112227.1 hypothetical protein [Rhodospirillales bacterium]MBT5671928.1 hypothetical protein [Rhodospirillales bacterium]
MAKAAKKGPGRKKPTDGDTDRDTDRDIGALGGIDIVGTLSGWSEAVTVSAMALIAPPLLMIGVKPAKPKKGQLGRMVRGFPIVGLGVGLFSALIYALLNGLNLPPVLAAILAVSTMIYCGGASSEGGLARMADALVAGGSKTQHLSNLKAEQFGSYGTIVLVISFSVRVAAIALIASPGAVTAALGASCAASWAVMAVALHYLPPAKKTGFTAMAGRPDWNQMILTIMLGAAIALFFLKPVVGIVALAVGALGAFKFFWFAREKFGGITGDTLGAIQQGAELGMLLAIVALI